MPGHRSTPVGRRPLRWRPALTACALALAALMVMTGSAAATQADYQKAYRIGLEAYTYGLPLLETNKTFLSQTSINVTKGAFGPVNQFNSVRKLNDPNSKSVVAPGANALSSIAWLDLRKEPQVMHIPRVRDHYYVLALLNPYTEDFRNYGSAHDTRPGDYVILGPGQHHLTIPKGTHRIEVDYTRMWIIGSTQLKGKSDLASVHKIQNGYRLTPLSKYGTDYRPPRPAHPRTTVKSYSLPAGLRFFDVLGQQMKKFPPAVADRAYVRTFAAVGIGPGMTPSRNRHLSPDTIRGLKDAVTAGPGQVKKDAGRQFIQDYTKHNGYLLGGFGHYGRNYVLRAVIAKMGLGAFSSDQSIFALAVTDRYLQPLSGSARYVLHLPSAPPVVEGWTVTVYTSQGFLIPNALKRYQFNDSSPLARNADGSIDIYLQATQPAEPAQLSNWLPISGQGIEVIWRLLAPKPSAIRGILNGSGWQPPAISAVQ
jgi:hypothetical protein